jgi:hypothetical protein
LLRHLFSAVFFACRVGRLCSFRGSRFYVSRRCFRLCAFTLLLGGYLLEPSLESIPALTAPANQGLLKYLPSYWFLGLFQQLNGSMQPAFALLAVRAWIGLSIAATMALMLLSSAWLWRLRRAVEQPDILPGRSGLIRLPRRSNLVETAVVQFSLCSLLRSRQHRILLYVSSALLDRRHSRDSAGESSRVV